MSITFGDFLSEMTGEKKISSQQIQSKKQPQKKIEEQVEDDFEIEDDFEEDLVEDTSGEDDDSEDSLSIMEKSLEYSKSVLKIIKQSFSSKDQKYVIETLRNSLNMLLNESAQTYREQPVYVKEERAQGSKQIQNTKAKSAMFEGQTITPEQYSAMSDDDLVKLEKGEQAPKPQVVSESRNRDYNKELNLGVKMGVNGTPEVDLSKVTPQDIADMKVLMGI